MKSPVDLIFFDVDGTLIDARKDIVNAVNFSLKKLGVRPKPAKEVISYVGTGVSYLIRKSLGPRNKDLVERGVRLFSDYYVRHPVDEAKLYPHVTSTLEYFRKKPKIIITNRYKRFAEAALKGLGIRDYFEEIIGGDDEDCLKPSACVLTNIMSHFKVPKNRMIIIGDMAIDVRTGKNAGIKTCFVTYGLGRRSDIKSLRPDYIIDDIGELKNKIA